MIRDEFFAADSKHEQDRIEMWCAEGRIGDLSNDLFGAKRDAESGGGQHVEVVGSIADGHDLFERDSFTIREFAQIFSLGRAVNDRAGDLSLIHI